MDLHSNKSADKLYKVSALVFLQGLAVKSNEYDCLIDNNLKMFEVIGNVQKKWVSHDGSPGCILSESINLLFKLHVNDNIKIYISLINSVILDKHLNPSL